MKTQKLMAPLVLIFSVIMCANVLAKSGTAFKKAAYANVPQFETLGNLDAQADSVTLTCFLSDNTPSDWTVILNGADGQGSFTFNVDAATFATGVLGKVPRGMYAIEFQCNDYPIPDLEMDFYSDSWTASAYLGDGQNYTHIPQANIGINDTYAEIDFGPWIH